MLKSLARLSDTVVVLLVRHGAVIYCPARYCHLTLLPATSAVQSVAAL